MLPNLLSCDKPNRRWNIYSSSENQIGRSDEINFGPDLIGSLNLKDSWPTYLHELLWWYFQMGSQSTHVLWHRTDVKICRWKSLIKKSLSMDSQGFLAVEAHNEWTLWNEFNTLTFTLITRQRLNKSFSVPHAPSISGYIKLVFNT